MQTNADGSRECKACEIGKWQQYTKRINCQTCPAGSYTKDFITGSAPNEGATGCTGCGSGKYNDPADAECESCPAGKKGKSSPTGGRRDTEANSCEDCSPGKYRLVGGGPTCSTCVAGKWAAGPGPITSCTDCVPGKYSPNRGRTTSSDCLDCPIGQYQDGSGEPGCIASGKGYFNPSVGATTREACPAGKQGRQASLSVRDTEANSCRTCPEDTYHTGTNPANRCKSCPAGKYTAGQTGQTSSSACTTRYCYGLQVQAGANGSGIDVTDICDINNPGSGNSCKSRFVAVDSTTSVGASARNGKYYQCQWIDGHCRAARATGGATTSTPWSSSKWTLKKQCTPFTGTSSHPKILTWHNSDGRGDNHQCDDDPAHEKCSIGDGDCDGGLDSDECMAGLDCKSDYCNGAGDRPGQGTGGGLAGSPTNYDLDGTDDCCWWMCDSGWQGTTGETLPPEVTFTGDNTPYGCRCAAGNFQNKSGDDAKWRCHR